MNSKKYQSKLDWMENIIKKVYMPQEKNNSNLLKNHNIFFHKLNETKAVSRIFQ